MTAPPSSPDPAADAHPSVDELADLAEDLLPPADTDALRGHLTGCADCRETVDALAEVRLLLAEDEPPAMPADVVSRIDAALVAAAAQDAAVPSPSSSVPPAPPAPPTAPPARPAAATGPGRTARPRRRRTLLLGSAAALLVLGLGGAFLSLSTPSPKQDSTVAANAAAPSGSAAAKADPAPDGTVYREEQLTAQVRELLAETAGRPVLPTKPSGGAGADTGSAPADGSDVSAAPPAEGGQGLSGGGRSAPACPPPSTAALLATGRGSYAGTPAELLVYALPGRSDQLDVYLRSADCGLLLHRTVPAG
ncbi:hypothetical protein ABZW10_10600 [Kitasatospora sp. NPDC004723]|uniref:hypothetical protein n=1 Tax=Kitasatospora sp. NPDC004723 TaxID=3154288 RepID=UPI0033B30FA9